MYIPKLSELQFTQITANKYYQNVLEEAFPSIQSAVAFFLKEKMDQEIKVADMKLTPHVI